jgi:hypothetical protein
MKARQMPLGETPLGPIDTWSVSSMLFGALSAVLSAMLYLYRGRELERVEQVKELRQENVEIRTWCKDLQAKAEECHKDRFVLFGQLQELRNQIQKLTGGS